MDNVENFHFKAAVDNAKLNLLPSNVQVENQKKAFGTLKAYKLAKARDDALKFENINEAKAVSTSTNRRLYYSVYQDDNT